MYVCMYPWCMYVCMYVCMHLCMNICVYVCMYVCMYACMYECMYVCLCVCIHTMGVMQTHVNKNTCTHKCSFICAQKFKWKFNLKNCFENGKQWYDWMLNTLHHPPHWVRLKLSRIPINKNLLTGTYYRYVISLIPNYTWLVIVCNCCILLKPLRFFSWASKLWPVL
jgi:hypothetical protein